MKTEHRCIMCKETLEKLREQNKLYSTCPNLTGCNRTHVFLGDLKMQENYFKRTSNESSHN